MVSKEDFMWVWKDSSRESILNQFYCEHIELRKEIELEKENEELKQKIEHLKNKAENKDKWCQLIADIGYDYDGYRQADSLMKLIDELVKYALYARDDHDFDTTMGIE